MLPINPQRMLEDLRALAEFGKLSTGVNRRALRVLSRAVERIIACGSEDVQ